MTSQLCIIQTTTPDYRKKFFDYLYSNIADFSLFAGETYFEPSVKTDTSITYLNPIKNIYLFNRRFLFQTGMWRLSLTTNMIVLEMNPRIISNWLILIFRGVLGKKTILWGHAWPRQGKNSKSDLVRGLMRRLASSIIVYTKSQQKELALKMPKKQVFAAPNALYSKSDMKIAHGSVVGEVSNFIYVGRLTKTKKPLFLVKAFASIISKLPKEVILNIVGEGEEKKVIEEYVKKHSLENRIKLLGHISSFSNLKNLYSTSIASISPGYVGLSITQSFAFGIPMIISRGENHSPEIEAATESENAVFFETDNGDDLGMKILETYSHKANWISSREEICSVCREHYSVESMAQVFLNNNIIKP